MAGYRKINWDNIVSTTVDTDSIIIELDYGDNQFIHMSKIATSPPTYEVQKPSQHDTRFQTRIYQDSYSLDIVYPDGATQDAHLATLKGLFLEDLNLSITGVATAANQVITHGKLDDIESDIENGNTLLADIELNQEDQETLLVQIRDNVDTVEPLLSSIQANQITQETTLNNIETNTNNLESILTDVELNQEDQEALLVQIEANQDIQETTLNNIETNTDNLESILTDVELNQEDQEALLVQIEDNQTSGSQLTQVVTRYLSMTQTNVTINTGDTIILPAGNKEYIQILHTGGRPVFIQFDATPTTASTRIVNRTAITYDGTTPTNAIHASTVTTGTATLTIFTA